MVYLPPAPAMVSLSKTLYFPPNPVGGDVFYPPSPV
jgi:hypothetical protein